MVHQIRIAVGVDDRNDLDAQLASLTDRDGFLAGVDDEHRVRQLLDVLDAAEGAFQLGLLAAVRKHFLLGQRLDDLGVVGHFLQLLEPFDALPDGLEVGQRAAQPPVMDIGHAAAFRLFPDRILRLLLGPHEQDVAAGHDQVADLGADVLHHPHGLLQVDDVNPVPSAENVGLHLGIPATGLMAEVHPGLQKLLHGYIRHNARTSNFT